MINEFLKKFLRKIFKFSEQNLKIKFSSKTPVDFYLDDLSREAYTFFSKEMVNCQVFDNDESIREYSITKSLEQNSSSLKESLFLEFGVFRGNSINFFAKILKEKKIYGFDSFEGLEEDWITSEFNKKGTFSTYGKKPKVFKNVNLICGKIQETLEIFLKDKAEKKISFIHLDVDNYLPTKFILEKIKPFLKNGTVILFDEFYGFPNWKNYEYKALNETFDKKNYKFIAFSTRQVAIEITNIINI